MHVNKRKSSGVERREAGTSNNIFRAARGSADMSHIPNPFLNSDTQQPRQPQTPTGPGFLLMTRPPSGSNSLGRGGLFSPSHRHSPNPSDSFIPLSGTRSNNSQNNSRRGGFGGRFSQGGGGRGQGSPRMFSPYHPSPSRGGGKWTMGIIGSNQGSPFTPSRQGGNWDSYSNHRQNRYSNGGSRGGRDRGPISDTPIEKFVSPSMVKNPWAEFNMQVITPVTNSLVKSLSNPSLDDSEIIIDSDTSVAIENSYEGGISGTEGDSSPVPDTGSDSPYIATSSTSDKDGGSDSTGDD